LKWSTKYEIGISPKPEASISVHSIPVRPVETKQVELPAYTYPFASCELVSIGAKQGAMSSVHHQPISPTALTLFDEDGRVMGRERTMQIGGLMDPMKTQQIENHAMSPESLLAVEYPLTGKLADIRDKETSKNDSIVKELSRCASLLEIYRVFPSILWMRFKTCSFHQGHKVNFEFPIPRFGSMHEETDKKLWIVSLALHILDSLATLPLSIESSCSQLILLATAACELKYVSSIDYFSLYANEFKVFQARNFVNWRLNEYALRLPTKPIWRVINMVTEVWQRFDSGQEVCWMDVMIEKGWINLYCDVQSS
jgi:hypothetical protein